LALENVLFYFIHYFELITDINNNTIKDIEKDIEYNVL